jgi:hypothetical protein
VNPGAAADQSDGTALVQVQRFGYGGGARDSDELYSVRTLVTVLAWVKTSEWTGDQPVDHGLDGDGDGARAGWSRVCGMRGPGW